MTRFQNWVRSRSVIEFLELWETLHDPDFKPLEIEGVKSRADSNAFTLSPNAGWNLEPQSECILKLEGVAELSLTVILHLNSPHGFLQSLNYRLSQITNV